PQRVCARARPRRCEAGCERGARAAVRVGKRPVWDADFMLCKPKSLCYRRTLARVVPGSSAVEQPAVNRLVAGSNPARGAKISRMNSGFLEPGRLHGNRAIPSGHHWVTKSETAPTEADAVDGGLELPFKGDTSPARARFD